MAVHWSPGFEATAPDGSVRRGAFLDSDLHPELPEDAVYITPSRHAELMEQQASGARIETNPASGRPIAVRPSADERRAGLTSAIKAEAHRRILAVSPLWRQCNDLREPGPAAEARFARIDAIRAASEAIEAEAAQLAAAALEAFDATQHSAWPTDEETD